MTSSLRLLLVLCLLALPSLAHAADGSFSVDYQVDEECPKRDRFIDEVHSRTANAVFLTEGAARHVAVRIDAREGGYNGTLRIQHTAGSLESREVPGSSCQEVVSAMALITALDIDPLASTEPIALDAPPSQRVPAAPSPESALVERPKTRAPELAAPAESRLSSVPWRFGFGLGATAAVGPAPNPLWGGDAAVQLSNRPGGVFPLMRLDVGWSQSIEESTAAGNASFDLLTFRLSAYPFAFAPAHGWEIGPWFWFEAGRLHARGSGVDQPDEAAILWGAGGFGGRTTVLLSSSWFAGARAGAVLPLVRDAFYFEQNPVFHEVPAIGVIAGLDFGWVLP